MNPSKYLVIVFASCWVALGAEIPLDKLLKPNNVVDDASYGLSLQYPAGWKVRRALRTEAGETRIFFRPLWPTEARPRIYYEKFGPGNPRPTNARAYFRERAENAAKTIWSVNDSDYYIVEDSFAFHHIKDRPAVSYTALYRGGTMAHSYVRILGQAVCVTIWAVGPARDVMALTRELERIAETVEVS